MNPTLKTKLEDIGIGIVVFGGLGLLGLLWLLRTYNCITMPAWYPAIYGVTC